MSACPFITGCPFYNEQIPDKPAIIKMYKSKYCTGNFENCARWKIATNIGREAVPSNLFPNQLERANQIINKKS